MSGMQRSVFQFSVAAMLGLVACIALNVWLFRLSILLGIIGLNISKHIVIAYLCQILGVDRRRAASASAAPASARLNQASAVAVRQG
jgi:hypothetical protein